MIQDVHVFIKKVRKNGFIRLIKIRNELLFDRIRGICFGLINTSPKFPKNLRVGKNVKNTARHIKVGENVYIGSGCSFGGLGTIELKNQVVINRNSHFDAASSITIGENVLVAPDCYFVDSNHVMNDGILISAEIVKSEIHIENDVWIGRGVSVLMGTTIGESSIIGSGAVVTKSIPPGATAVGVPAKCIKSISSAK